jgi:hypothetical protein
MNTNEHEFKLKNHYHSEMDSFTKIIRENSCPFVVKKLQGGAA